MISCEACDGRGYWREYWRQRHANGAHKGFASLGKICPVCGGTGSVDESLTPVEIRVSPSGRGYFAEAFVHGQRIKCRWDYSEAEALEGMGVGKDEPHAVYRLYAGAYRLAVSRAPAAAT